MNGEPPQPRNYPSTNNVNDVSFPVTCNYRWRINNIDQVGLEAILSFVIKLSFRFDEFLSAGSATH